MATWTVNGIGSNSTGSFTLPANTGTTDKSYTVTYDDGNGNTATTSVTVSACDIEYVFMINDGVTSYSVDVPCSGDTVSAFIASYTRTSNQDYVSTVNCSVTSAPSWISSYSLSPSEVIGGFDIEAQVPANTAGSRSGTFTVTQNESGEKVSFIVNQPNCSKTRNIIICSTGTTSENKLVLHLAAQDHRIPIGTSIKCLFDVVYIHRTDDSSGHTLVELTLEGGSTYDEVVTEVSLDTYIVKSYCYASKGVDSDDTYYYVYLPDC